jgi:hypothetical protein
MHESGSIPNYIAIVIYIVCAAAAAVTARFTSRRGLPHRDRLNWWGMACLLIFMAFSRVVGFEHRFSDYFRSLAHLNGVYNDRRELQKPLVAIILVSVAAGVGYTLNRELKKGTTHPAARMVFISQIAATILIVLMTLRMISLHSIDALLYSRGPARLNHILDLGSCIAIAACASYYRWTLRPGLGRSA